MKRYTLLFLLTFQMVISQEIIIKGQAFNSGKFHFRDVYIIKNDTINKLRKHSDFLVEEWKKKSKFEDQNDESYQEVTKNNAKLTQLLQDKNYRTKTDSLGNFEIKVKLTDSLFFESKWHITKKFLVSDLVKNKKPIIKLELEPCEVWPSHPEKPTKLYVFIGKKIKSWNSPRGYCNVGSLSSRILSKYLVVKNIYGDFKKDTIQFTTYPPHSPALGRNYRPFKTLSIDYEYCLLYVLEYNGELLQTRYIFDDLYMTKDGKWATPLKPKKLRNSIPPDSFRLKKIDFVTPIEFVYDERLENQIKENFSEAHNTIGDGKIRVNYGFYVDDLFEIRKNGTLKEFDYLIK